jgi:hypothetical protein
MQRAGPYAKFSREQRDALVAQLCEDWSRDWHDRLGLRPDGSMVWQVNAVDVMLLVAEIERLKKG